MAEFCVVGIKNTASAGIQTVPMDAASTSNVPFDRPSSSTDNCVPSHFLVELTSLDELTFPTNSSKRLKYTCVASCSKSLILGTSTGTVYVFSRYAARNRIRTHSPIPVQVFSTRDGPINTISISTGEEMMAIGGDSGRVTIAQLNSAMPPTLVYTLSGDARKPDKTTSLTWSADLRQLFSGHASGIVLVHRLGSRSVFRAAHEKLTSFEGEIVQMDVSGQHLLVATTFASFLYHLETNTFQQVGKKSRTNPSVLGSCFVRQNQEGDCEYVVTARPTGRLWESNLVGVVYKTHQFRQNKHVPRAPPISFRSGFPLNNYEFEGIHPANQDVIFHVLRKVTTDGKTFIVSAFGSRVLVVDADTSRIVIVSELDSEILDVATCGNDIFVLLNGSAGLRKYSLFERSKAIEKALIKSLFSQVAQVILFCSTSVEFPEEILQKTLEGVVSLSKKKETERLQLAIENILRKVEEKKANEGSVYDNLKRSNQTQEAEALTSPVSQRLPSGVYKVLKGVQKSGYEDDFTFNVPSSLRERSRSSPCGDEPRNSLAVADVVGITKRASVPLTIVETEESRKNGTPDVVEEDILHRARHILESDGKVIERDSLRFLLQLEDVGRDEIRFTPTVTIGNAAKALAELALAVPVDVSTMLESARPKEKHPTENSQRTAGGKRATIVKVVQPGVKPRTQPTVAVPVATMETNNDESPDSPERDDSNNVLRPETTRRDSENTDRECEEEKEARRRHDELWLDLRLSQFARESAKLREEEEAKKELSDTDTTTTTTPNQLIGTDEFGNNGEDSANRRTHCEDCGMHRSWAVLALLSAVSTRAAVSKDGFADGGVPATSSDWFKLLKSVAFREQPIDVQCICPRCETALSGASRAAGENGSRPEEEPSLERTAVGSNGSDLKAVPVETETSLSRSQCWKWTHAVELRTLLSLACVVQGCRKVIGMVGDGGGVVASRMHSADWAAIVHMSCREQTTRKNPITAKAMMDVLEGMRAADWVVVNSEEVRLPRATAIRPASSSQTPMHSWIVDTIGKCPICTLPVKTVVAGKDSGVSAFMCGHVYHVVCLARRTICIACRLRARQASRGVKLAASPTNPAVF